MEATIGADKRMRGRQLSAAQIDAFAIWVKLPHLVRANSETRRRYGFDQMGVYLP